MIHALHLALSLATSSQPVEESTPRTSAESAPVDIWTMPIGPVALAFGGAVNGETFVYVPIGVGFHLRGVQFGVEATTVYRSAPADSLAFIVAAGPVLHLHGRGWLDGFFVQPKVEFNVGYGPHWVEGRSGWAATDPLPSWATLVGVDVGYQLRWKSLYLALVVGAGLGYGVVSGGVGIPFAGLREPYPLWVFSVNANILKLGVTF